MARAKAIVAQMTLDEKIAQLHGIKTEQQYRVVPGNDRLKIPPLLVTNGPSGVGPGDVVQPLATALPAPISLAATWDVTASKRFGDVIGEETVHVGRNLMEAPTINIARIPTNGRTFEGYGEDPYLVGRMSVANIKAIQKHGVLANVKHYIANNQETNRFKVNEIIDERTLREIYLPAFEASMKEGKSASAMCAFPKINGTFSCEHPWLLNDLARDEWKWDGFYTSDFGAVHSTVESSKAGLDVEMPTGKFFGDEMKKAVAEGKVTEQEIDRKLVKRFAKMIEFGIFDRPITQTPIPAQKNGATARELAQQGMVLLKNNNVLPLTNPKSIALIGPYAGAAMTGGGGSSKVKPLYTVNPLDGLKTRTTAPISYTDGKDLELAKEAAKNAEVAIVMVGDNATEGRDKPSLALDGNQDALIEAVAAANPNTVVVLKSGGPVLMPWLDKVPALLEAWYPGEEDGNAVAGVLFGEVNPSGKLPITFPKAPGDVPANTPAQYPGIDGTATYSEGIFVGYRHYDAKQIQPLFPFGYGLSYTTFETKARVVGNTVIARVTNTGKREGSEVVQVYVGSPSTNELKEAPKELGAFAKVTLKPGECKLVTLTLNNRAFSHWDIATHGWKITPGRHQITVNGKVIGSARR
ncbi:glycoside hydrolase family 3 C-terminal domain-containing protein [Lentzea sp. NBRC 105346]|uniref:beta-glucosidase n=1 Tax=Lentzea sp. NBRC 105346 TaxID=3032205 RepID=UPI00255316A7|nr:glycoside hydrolase family 3 C-terminal domain-containing protein [Lentzea sp. NBRC 105346]